MTELHDKNQPYMIVGLSGPAGSGKTSTANALVPLANIRRSDRTFPTEWDHLYLAMPLYEMVSIKSTIEGTNMVSRQCYELHRVLSDLLGQYIPYKDLVELVTHIQSIRLPDGKPRTFFTSVGDICRGWRRDCFPDWIVRQVMENVRRIERDYDSLEIDEDAAPPPYPFLINIISDVRFINEAEYIKNNANSVLIDLVAREEVLHQRLLDRDGHGMTDEQKAHVSEMESRTPEFQSLVDKTIDTSDMTIEEQVGYVRDTILNMVAGVLA